MVRHASLFSQLVAFFRRSEFHNLVFRHKAERYTKGFNSWDQFVAMLFCQFAQAKSLRHQGEDLGSVDDLVANEQGKLEYLILSRGGVLGVGANLIAIPLDAVSPQITEDNELTINVDEATLDQAPTFASGDYPDFSDRQWQQESRGYFQNGAATSPGVRDDRERSPGMQQDRSPGMQQEQTPRGGAQDGDNDSPGRHSGRRDDSQGERCPIMLLQAGSVFFAIYKVESRPASLR